MPQTCIWFLFQAGPKPNGHKFSAQSINIRLNISSKHAPLTPSSSPRIAAQAGHKGDSTQSPISAPASAVTSGKTKTWTWESRRDEGSEEKTCMCEHVCTNQHAYTRWIKADIHPYTSSSGYCKVSVGPARFTVPRNTTCCSLMRNQC